MFIKSLLISTPTKVIREIEFHRGLNLIVDETVGGNETSGNNVGKTTILKLINFCLGHDAESIYKGAENKTTEYTLVKEFLINNKILISLTLVDNLESPSKTIEITKNFLSKRNESVCTLNEESIAKSELEGRLLNLIFPDLKVARPTFPQLIAHNIRYSEKRLTNAMKLFDTYKASDAEDYQTLYLYMFGCEYTQGEERGNITSELTADRRFKKRLEQRGSLSAYSVILDDINREIEKFTERKDALNINPELDADIEELNSIKEDLNRVTLRIGAAKTRKSIIEESASEFEAKKFTVDTALLKNLYEEVNAYMPELHRSFDELVVYHNQLQENKAQFIRDEIPALEEEIKRLQSQKATLIAKEKELTEKVVQSDTFEDLEELIKKLNGLHQRKGEVETKIRQLKDVDEQIQKLTLQMDSLDKGLFSDEFKKRLACQVNKFNALFSEISEVLYGERYVVSYKEVDVRGTKHYEFEPVSVNLSSGKKQGEISCFDIAYTKFADQEGIPCLHFLLNDKKELMHGNQLERLAEVVERENVQFVMSILEDKLPDSLREDAYYVVKLSETDKLFKIEQY